MLSLLNLVTSLIIGFASVANAPQVFTAIRVYDSRTVIVGDIWLKKSGMSSVGYIVTVERTGDNLWKCDFSQRAGKYKGQLVIQTDISSGKIKTNKYLLIYDYYE